MRSRPDKLLVGIGNVLHRDEGLGVYVAQHFKQLRLPTDIEIYGAGTYALELADLISGRRLVVVVDTLDAGRAPGMLFRLYPEQLRPEVHSGLSLHDLHLLDALAEARLIGAAPNRVVVIAVQVADVSVGIGLSKPVRRSMSRVNVVVAREFGLPTSVLRRPPSRAPTDRQNLVGIGSAAAEDGSWK